MSNPNKQKGTRAETRVVNYLTAHGLKAERKALKGNKDEGDIQVYLDPKIFPDGYDKITFEVKTGKQTSNYNRKQLDEWRRQARVESINCKQSCLLVIVRYGRKIEDAEVWMSDGTRRMMYLDEWVANSQY